MTQKTQIFANQETNKFCIQLIINNIFFAKICVFCVLCVLIRVSSLVFKKNILNPQQQLFV